jgi:hypothetical protein
MKKVLVAALICAVSSFAAWDYFPVIEDGKGEAKISFTQSREGKVSGDDETDFKIRYSPLGNLELLSTLGYTLGARYQIISVISAGLDIGFPIPEEGWSFTPNAQFSMPLTEALTLGTNGQVTIYTEKDKGLDLSAGFELDLAVGKSTVWIGCDFNREDLDDKDKGTEIAPAIGYIASVGNLSLGTSVGMAFGKAAGHENFNTFIGLDASIQF